MISVIIPTYNESAGIAKLVQYLLQNSRQLVTEIIITDGGSTDNTVDLAKRAGAIGIVSQQRGRAAQMNLGAAHAKGNILYFIHADTVPPATYATDIMEAVNEGYGIGRYQTKFDSPKPILRFNAFFTRFDWFICYGGDQTLFVTRKVFDELQGYDESMQIMEDYEIVVRAKKLARYKIFPKQALVSARKYDPNTWLSVQLANRKIVRMYQKGASQQEMVKKYREMLALR